MYTYTHIYIYIYVYVHLHLYVHIYIYIYTCFLYVYVDLCLRTYKCTMLTEMFGDEKQILDFVAIAEPDETSSIIGGQELAGCAGLQFRHQLLGFVRGQGQQSMIGLTLVVGINMRMILLLLRPLRRLSLLLLLLLLILLAATGTS